MLLSNIDVCFRSNQEFIKKLSIPPPGLKYLYFRTKYSQPFLTQTKACFLKQYWSNWRHPQYNAIRFLMTILASCWVWFSAKHERKCKLASIFILLNYHLKPWLIHPKTTTDRRIKTWIIPLEPCTLRYCFSVPQTLQQFNRYRHWAYFFLPWKSCWNVLSHPLCNLSG